VFDILERIKISYRKNVYSDRVFLYSKIGVAARFFLASLEKTLHLTNDIAIKYRITLSDESLKLVRAFFAFGKRESRMGVAPGCTARGSKCQTARHRDAELAFTLDAMDFWRSENGVYGLVAIQD